MKHDSFKSRPLSRNRRAQRRASIARKQGWLLKALEVQAHG